MNRLAIVAAGLALAVAMGTSTTAAAQSPPPATIFQACSGGQRSSIGVTFAWSPTPGALQQWLDLSLFDNGFQPGTFLGAPIELGMETAYWDGIAPELPHFYRVNVLYPNGWVTVASGSFVSIGGCPKPTAIVSAPMRECIGSDVHDTTFMWLTGGGDSQWLDFAWSAEEMALDTYHAYGPLSPDTGSYKLRIPNNIPYWWRVNTHSAAGWSPSAVWYFGGAHCPVEAPPAAPPPTPDPQATIAQWNACYDTWETGYSVELQIALQKMAGADTSYAARQYESLRGYLTSYCVGIGARTGAIPGSASCFDMLSYASSISSIMPMYKQVSGGDPSYFLAFAKREIDGFLAAARC